MPFVENVPFRAELSRTHVPANGPRFLVTSPARGTTPANGGISLDPSVVPFLAPGVYAAGFGYAVDLPGQPRGAGGFFTLRIPRPPDPVVNAVLNSATYKPAISPGAAVSIFGTNIGSPALAAKFDEFGVYPTSFGNSSVTFNGIAAPLTYVSKTQINSIVPHELAGQSSARVVVRHHTQESAEFGAPLQETAPGIFTTSQDGNGQGAILQTPRVFGAPVTVNSASNPAEKGGAIVLFATGAGLWNQDVRAGQILFAPQARPMILPKAEVSVKVGGLPARILYAGGAPGTAGLVQVNAIVPDEVTSGIQVVELIVGQNTNARQQQVTIAVR